MTTLPQNDIPLVPKQAEPRLWPEPLDTPGLIPLHMKRAATSSFPVLEVLQRLLLRLRPLQSTGSDLEKSLALIGLYQATRPLIRYLKNFLVWAFTVQITIPENDAVSKEILAWMGSEVVSKSRTRSAMLVTGGMEITHQHYGRQLRMTPPPHRVGGRVDTEVSCVPPLGTRVFWIGFRPYLFSRLGDQARHRGSIGLSLNEDGQMQNALTIMTLGWTLAPLNAFTNLCHEFKLKNMTGTTTVYFAGGGYDAYGDGWQSVSKAVRKLDTVDMDPDVKADLVKDAEYYYSESSRQYFADCGIPYRRGYLFHGPPGTGKTSFTAALAGHLQCDLYHINLSSGDISDGRLHRLFLSLPIKCIVVIEDIDSAGIGREQGPASQLARFSEPETRLDISTSLPNGIPPPPPPPPPAPGAIEQFTHITRNTVTLSGLLNAVDGNASAEGRLLILTSNNPDALDAALTRPGRIDKKVHFGYMSQAAGQSIFMRLIGRSAVGPDTPYSMMEDFAAEFATKVPANTFTPAQVQQFLHDCRGDPMKALGDIEAWVEHNRGAVKTKTTQISGMSASDTSTSTKISKTCK